MMRPPRSIDTTVTVSIGIAAAHVGVHPQTLREYERHGLIQPRRTPGGTRRYGPGELERLTRIQQLTAEGLSLAGARYVLQLEDELRQARARIAELEGHSSASTVSVRRSMSVELVHVPRPPRSPRWRNEE